MNHNGWKDIFYNYLIAPNGTIVEGRDLQYASNEYRYVTVCFLGNFEIDELTDQAKNAMLWLKAILLDQGVLNHLVYHGQRDNTACPGRNIKRWFDEGMPGPGISLEGGNVVVTGAKQPAFSQPIVINNAVDWTKLKDGGIAIVTESGHVYVFGSNIPVDMPALHVNEYWGSRRAMSIEPLENGYRIWSTEGNPYDYPAR